jgi:2-amino-4-hydroxy-6-hydroxymethyldihydropteridine diphosphokinase
MPAPTDVYVAAGSNIEPLPRLCTALQALTKRFGSLRISPAYRNAAVGFAGEDFINLVVAFATHETPHDVRAQLQEIEAVCGRPPNAPKWAPRAMDLDMLLYGNLFNDEPGLLLPRPDLVKRPYMLKPMADLAPDLKHPTLQRTMRQLWQQLETQGRHEMVEVSLGCEW